MEENEKSVEEQKIIKEKVKKNVLYLSLFSIVMLFAGLTSAYLVVQRDSFWVVLDMPISFWISTIIIIMSSGTIFWSLRAAKSNNQSMVKASLGITLILSILFTFFQFKGWNGLIEKGSYFTSNIYNMNGRYGDQYTIYHDGQEIVYDNNEYYKGGELVSEDVEQQMKVLSQKILDGDKKKYELGSLYGEMVLYYGDSLVTYNNNKLYIGDDEISNIQTVQLEKLADNIVNNRGDFFLKGKYGEDFYITYKGKTVEYENRNFYLDGQQLSAAQYDKLRESRNTASSFIYIFSFVHWLHLLGGIIYLIILFRKSLKNEFDADNQLKLKLGNIYWHFLGGLWIYLFLFLNYIN